MENTTYSDEHSTCQTRAVKENKRKNLRWWWALEWLCVFIALNVYLSRGHRLPQITTTNNQPFGEKRSEFNTNESTSSMHLAWFLVIILFCTVENTERIVKAGCRTLIVMEILDISNTNLGVKVKLDGRLVDGVPLVDLCLVSLYAYVNNIYWRSYPLSSFGCTYTTTTVPSCWDIKFVYKPSTWSYFLVLSLSLSRSCDFRHRNIVCHFFFSCVPKMKRFSFIFYSISKGKSFPHLKISKISELSNSKLSISTWPESLLPFLKIQCDLAFVGLAVAGNCIASTRVKHLIRENMVTSTNTFNSICSFLCAHVCVKIFSLLWS